MSGTRLADHRSPLAALNGENSRARVRKVRGDSSDVILRLAGEVRHQQHLQLTLMATLVDLKVVREFQEVVVGVIRDESPTTAQRIVTKLKERRALRPHANLPVRPLSASDTDVA